MNTTTFLMERRFFIGFGFLVAFVVFAGFSQFLLSPAVHGSAPDLSASFPARTALHQLDSAVCRSGRACYDRPCQSSSQAWHCRCFSAGVLLVSGWDTAIAAARLGHIPAAKSGVTDPLAALAIPLRDLLVFAALAATALYFRRHTDIHKRLMVLATINLLPPALGRIPMPDPLVGVGMLVFLLAGPVYDRFTRGRVHWIYWSGGCITIVSMFVQFTLGRTETWHHLPVG